MAKVLPTTRNMRAFADSPERGNPATVIEVNDATCDAEVLPLVREARHSVSVVISLESHTAFLIRFFYEFGGKEPHACGHATLAAAAHVFSDETYENRCIFLTSGGDSILADKLEDGRIRLRQKDTITISRDRFDSQEVADVLGIDDQFIRSSLPIRLIGFPGKKKLMIPVSSREVLLGIERDFPGIKAFCDAHDGVTGLFPFALKESGETSQDAHARHFPPRDEEDKVCGVGSQALAKYLQKMIYRDQHHFKIINGPGRYGQGRVGVGFEGDMVTLEGKVLEEPETL